MRPRPDRRSRWAAVALAALALLVTACQPTPVPTRPGTDRIVLLGDSIPAFLIRDGAATGVDTSRFTLVDGTLSACEPTVPYVEARASTGKVVPVPDACRTGWRKLYPPHLTVAPAVAVVMPGTHAMLDRRIDGVWTHPCRAAARNAYRADVLARLRYLKATVDQVVVVLPAWPEGLARWIIPEADRVQRATCVRDELLAAAQARGVPLVDFGAYLCPTSPTACRAYRTKDGMHVDPGRASAALRWLLTEVAEAADL